MSMVSDTYIKQIKALFPVMGKKEKEYIRKVEQQIKETLPEMPSYTLEDLYEKIGDPKKVVWEYYNLVDPSQFKKRISNRKYIRSFVVVLLAAVVILESYGWYTYQQHYKIAMREKAFVESTN